MRWRGKVAYDGTDFLGWQSQPGGHTIQDFIEARLAQIFKTSIRIHGSGRTDGGVHARAQCFHFDANWKHDAEALLNALRVGIPPGISICEIKEVSTDFHARYSAQGKRYIYRIYEGFADPFEGRYYLSLERRKLDIQKMKQAAVHFVGRYDFTAFAANNGNEFEDNPVKDIRRFEVEKEGPRIHLITEGSGYLYKMVRSMAGALIDVGLGKLDPDAIKQIRDSKVRTRHIVTASPKGLTLDEVFYEL